MGAKLSPAQGLCLVPLEPAQPNSWGPTGWETLAQDLSGIRGRKATLLLHPTPLALQLAGTPAPWPSEGKAEPGALASSAGGRALDLCPQHHVCWGSGQGLGR